MPAKALTFKEFATSQGWSPSRVTKLNQTGRLVLSRAGRVKVKETLQLIAHTAGNRSDVAARHETARQDTAPAAGSENATAPASAITKAEKNAARVQQMQDGQSLKDANLRKALAESRRVAALADKEEMERDRMAGDLIAREDVDAAMKFIGAAIRGQMDVFPDQTAPLVAPVTSLEEAHMLLTEQCRNVLVEFGEIIKKQLAALAKGVA